MATTRMAGGGRPPYASQPRNSAEPSAPGQPGRIGKGTSARTGATGDGSKRPASELRVLIIEDDAFIAMDIEGTVEDSGHSPVAIGTTASQAVKLAERHRPDIVLMDLRLADGSFGGDAARAILERFGIRSIFLSGNLDPAMREHLADLEPIAMISKPFLPVDLERALAAAAERAN